MRYTDYLTNTQLLQTPLLCRCKDCPRKCDRYTEDFKPPYHYIIGQPFEVTDKGTYCKYELEYSASRAMWDKPMP